eukprot:4725367-Pyramimonas_sp.AAC.1
MQSTRNGRARSSRPETGSACTAMGEKARKARVAQARGISFLHPRRGDGSAARAVARARTFQSRKLD